MKKFNLIKFRRRILSAYYYRRLMRHLSQETARNIVFWSGGLMIGVMASVFAYLSSYIEKLFGHVFGHSFFLANHYHLIYLHRYGVLIVIPIGFMLIFFLTEKFFSGAGGSGIPSCIKALKVLNNNQISEVNRLLSLRTAFGKFILTISGFFFGASIGREGPTVMIACAMMNSLSNIKFAKFKLHYIRRGLIIAGSAAGIAATFNTPLAGIMFSIEEHSKSFESRLTSVIVMSIFLAGIVAIFFHGNTLYFGATKAILPAWQDWIVVPICGVIGGLFGGIFSKCLVTGVRKLSQKSLKQRLMIAGICGFLIAIIGILSNGYTYNSGYYEANQLIMNTGHVPVFYAFAKLLATLITYFSGIPGGIFAPSLSVGAGFGQIISQFFPSIPSSPIVIFAMLAYFSGVIRSPLTCFIIVTEMTGRYDLILTLMLTTLIADWTSARISKSSLYEELAKL